ncbi:MAG: DMT family transporter [Fimbriimonadaceae bacterium]|nr:DMT family transporter [Fimbriimonadaceae bacterium]QYK55310.1 MAG: DMT family transporter [Fimbriimonadaceae bacterium]
MDAGRRWNFSPYLAFVVVAWAANFSALKILFHDVQPAAAGLVRYVGMSLAVAGAVLASGGSLRYPKGTFWTFNLGGFLGSGVYMLLFLEGMGKSPAALGAIALATVPILTMLIGAAAGQERMTPRLVLGSLVGFLGVAIAILGRGQGSNGETWGALMVLAAAVVWALSAVVLRPVVTSVTPFASLALTLPGAAIVMLPYGTMAAARTDWGAVSWNAWVALAYLVVVAGMLGFSAYYKGLGEVGAARATMVQYFIPPAAAFFAWILLGSPLHASEAVGLVVTVAGVALASNRKPAAQPAVAEPARVCPGESS